MLWEHRDTEGWRIVVERGCWRDGRERVRIKKYQPTGKFYFCEGVTLSLDVWDALRDAARAGQREIVEIAKRINTDLQQGKLVLATDATALAAAIRAQGETR